MRRAAMLALICAGTMGLGAVALAQEYPPDFVLSADPSTVEPEGTVEAKVTGCTVGNTIEFDLEGSTDTDRCAGAGGGVGMAMAFVHATAQSAATGSVVAPPEPGVYVLTGTDLDDGRTASVEITVVAPDSADTGDADSTDLAETTASADELSSTGSSSARTAVWIAAVVLATGGALLVVARLRRRGQAAA
jgi:threonine dehydrogenase-like Zn-dependent dehydrogenase